MASSPHDNPPAPAPAGAIFLSYAREDTDAARRIADALRAFGVEVWFDQSELRGGDTWDSKIKKQIRECALFLPLVSQQTQERSEGYFRREWLLAVERTRDMASGRAFIVPVVIDETREADAAVPEEFMRYQWTRLAHGVPSPQFVEQVKRLLEAPRKATLTGRSAAAPVFDAPEPKKFPSWAWGVLAAAAIGAGAAFVVLRPSAKPAAEPKPAAVAAAPASEARKLVEKAKALQDDYAMDDTLRDNLTLAEELCKRAVTLDPADGEAWAVSARVTLSLASFESGTARLEQARSYVQRAIQLAPDSTEVRLAQADSLRKQGGAALAESEKTLRDLIQRGPPDKRVLRMLALVLNSAGRADEALVYYDRAAALPGGDSKALLNRASILFRKQRFAEAEAAVNESLALRPTASARIVKINFMVRRGDLDAARTLLEAVPASALVDDRAAYIASYLWIWRREPEKALVVLRTATRDYFTDTWIGGVPKASVAGFAHQLAGRPDAAMAEWRSALRIIDQKLAAAPNDENLLFQRASLLASLGEKPEAMRVFKLFEQLSASLSNYYPEDRVWDAADFLVSLGQNDEALAKLESLVTRKPENPYASPASRVTNLRLSPRWDPLRSNPRFEAVIKELSAQKCCRRRCSGRDCRWNPSRPPSG